MNLRRFLPLDLMRRDRVPAFGFTWCGLTDMTDWDVALRERRRRVGLFDLDHRERPVYRDPPRWRS